MYFIKKQRTKPLYKKTITIKKKYSKYGQTDEVQKKGNDKIFNV